MSEGGLLWHSRYCGRDTTGVLYKGPLTPSKKRATPDPVIPLTHGLRDPTSPVEPDVRSPSR